MLALRRSAVLVNGDLDASGSKEARKSSSQKPQPVTVRHSDLADKRGFVPLITQEDLDKDGSLGGAGNTTLDDVEVHFTSPNISGIEPHAPGGAGRRKHYSFVDANDLSAIQNANNGDSSLNQTNLELIRKLQSRANGGPDTSGEYGSETSIKKMDGTESNTQQNTNQQTNDDEQSDVNFKLDQLDI